MSRSYTIAVILILAALAVTAMLGTWPWSSTKAPNVENVNDSGTSGSQNESEERVDGRVEVKDDTPATDPPKTLTKKKRKPDERGVPVVVSRIPLPKHFLLPDGTWAPNLNDVDVAPAMQWPQDRPWSPIKKKIVDLVGKEWYVHEDGSYTNTEMMYRSDIKRAEGVTNVANPAKVRPIQGGSPGEKKLGPRRDQ